MTSMNTESFLNAEASAVISVIQGSTGALSGKAGNDNGIGEVNHFRNSKSGDTTDDEESERSERSARSDSGAPLREGGVPVMYSRDYFGLIFQNGGISLLYNTFPRMVYPFFVNYLHLDGYQSVAATTLLQFPWSLKFLFGMLTDSVPILGYRRVPYMLLGWLWTTSILVYMTFFLPVDEPYYLNPDDPLMNPNSDESIPLQRINQDAPKGGLRYVLFMMAATFGAVLASAALDGMIVSLAQREPEYTRGSIQTNTYLTRTFFTIIAIIFVAVTMNGREYGGYFDWSLGFNTVMGILAAATIFVMFTAMFFIKEQPVYLSSEVTWLTSIWSKSKDGELDKIPTDISCKNRCYEIYTIIQQRAVYQILAYRFISGVFLNFNATPASIVQREWAGVQPFQQGLFSVLGQLVFAATLFYMKYYGGFQCDWRWTIGITTVLAVAVDAFVSLCTIFDVVRNQWFWLGVPLLQELPSAINYIVSSFVCVEVADEGYEAATYALFTTMSNLAAPFSATIYISIDSFFDAYIEDIKRDQMEDRWQVAYTFIIMYIAKLVSLFWLFLMPRQKKEARLLKQNGGSSKLAGNLVLFVFLFAALTSVSRNMLSLSSITTCMEWAGGQGCDSSNS